MAGAIIKGLLHASVVPPGSILASDVKDERLAQLTATHGIRTTKDNLALAREVDVLVLSVKPQVLEKTLRLVTPAIRKETLVISIAAGVPLEALEGQLPEGTRVVRTMPNTPGHGARRGDGDRRRHARDRGGSRGHARALRGHRAGGHGGGVAPRRGDRPVRQRPGVRHADDRGAGRRRGEGRAPPATPRCCSRRRRSTDRRSCCSRPASTRGG